MLGNDLLTDTELTPNGPLQICAKRIKQLRSRSYSCSSHLGGHRSTRQQPRFRDAYTVKQEEARHAANIARSAETKARRAVLVGDPIRGAPHLTPFILSFDFAKDPTIAPLAPAAEQQADEIRDISAEADAKASMGRDSNAIVPAIKSPEDAAAMDRASVSQNGQLNHFFTADDLDTSLNHSERLAAPYVSSHRPDVDVAREAWDQDRHKLQHAVRREAVSRILAPENASSHQRTKINTQRCIDKFGRHNTDGIFEHQRASNSGSQGVLGQLRQRAGPDTGSSEVQVAILTAKIRTLVSEFEGRSRNDKVNKRNLRLMLHRRQKLLKYFEKKDRGGPRWLHLLETLGLTKATWKGEINVQ